MNKDDMIFDEIMEATVENGCNFLECWASKMEAVRRSMDRYGTNGLKALGLMKGGWAK